MPGTLLSALCVSFHFTCLYPNCPVRKVHYDLCFTGGEFEVCADAKAQAEVLIFTVAFEKLPILQRYLFLFMSLHFGCGDIQLLQVPLTTCSFILSYLCLACFLCLKHLFIHPSHSEPSLVESFLIFLRRIKCASQYIYMAPHHVIV